MSRNDDRNIAAVEAIYQIATRKLFRHLTTSPLVASICGAFLLPIFAPAARRYPPLAQRSQGVSRDAVLLPVL